MVPRPFGYSLAGLLLLLSLMPPHASGQPSSLNQQAAQRTPSGRLDGANGGLRAFEGKPVVNVAFDPPEQPIEGRELFEIMPVKRGELYSAQTIRAAVERLYRSGRYRDIAVDVTPVPGGVTVLFQTKQAWFIGKVFLSGAPGEPPNSGQLVNASRLLLGQPFDESLLAPAIANMQRLLRQNGYFHAEITHQLEYLNRYQQVNVRFQIVAQKRARYDEPEVTGDLSVLSEKQIVSATHWKRFLLPGFRGTTQNRTRSGVDSIRLKYENANRLLATVALRDIEDETNVDPKHPAAKPRLVVTPGPKVDITAVGAKVSRRKIKQNIPVFEEHTIDQDLLAEGATNLRDYFQSQGYFEAEVEFKEQQIRNGKSEIVYLINLGSRHTLMKVDIRGNSYFNDRAIRERLFLTPKSVEFRRGRYSEALRRRDEEDIAELYRSNGFRDVNVTSNVVDSGGKTETLAVTFQIKEGPQYTVASLDVSGPTPEARKKLEPLLSRLSSQPGQPFSEFSVAEDRAAIQQFYYESGYTGVSFEWDSVPASKPNTIDLKFVITEGPQQFVREVVTSGLTTTRPSIVNKQLMLNPGDALSPTYMAETQRRLYDLGIFASVDMAVQNPDGDTTRKYVLYEMEEASRYSITGGFGIEFARIGGSSALNDFSDPGGATGVNARVSLDLSRLNFLGLGHTVSLRTRYSTLQKRALLNYVAPRIQDNPNLEMTFSVLYDNTHDVRTFQSKREEGSVQLSQRKSKSTTLFYRFNYRNVGVSDLKIDPLLLPRLTQTVRVGISSFNIVQDRRDDPTDSHKGVYNTLDVGLASKIFGSQTSFVRLLARNATYHRLGEKFVLARETQFGWAPAFSVSSNADPSDAIPLPERFFGGGGNTLRGFPENQAGPRDLRTGFPLGGSALFFNNTELRFPLYGANVNGVLFHDAGNIYSSLGNLTFGVKQHDESSFNYMEHAVGFGIRFRTPVGPLRLDLAYSINPPKYNGFAGNYVQLVQCSAANTCQASLQRISHFQFFFSIGQAF